MSTRHRPGRRTVLTALAAGATGASAPVLLGRGTASAADLTGNADGLPSDLFTLGVASGDPEPDGVVLWTRLAPDPLAGGGMPDRPVPVLWQVSDRPDFRWVREGGLALARPELGHSVHVEVHNLHPDREYWYRFRVFNQISPVGRTRTAPARDARPGSLKFLTASCQNWQDGYFTPWHHGLQEDVSFVAFLGDHIYESGPRDTTIRRHEGTGEPVTVEQYRNRYAQYRTDPNLRAMHAHVPWIVTLDDHEVDNNWAGEIPQDPDVQTPEAFRARRIAAFQAFWEHMPLRRSAMPRGLDLHLYRTLHFGQLASLHVLDTRQYRSDQPNTMEEAMDPARTMTGAEQERWLLRGMERSGARWNLLANQVLWAQNDRLAGPEVKFDFDNWDGYRVQRRRMLEFFGSGRTSNPVVLTGDRHATFVCDLKPDFDDPASPVVGAEITGSSISSGGDSDTADWHRFYDPIKAESPHWKYIDIRRAYVRCELTPKQLLAQLRTVDTVWAPEGSKMITAAEFAVQDGVPGIELTGTPIPPEPMRHHARGYDVDDDQWDVPPS